MKKWCKKCNESQIFVHNGLSRGKQRYSCTVCRANKTDHDRNFTKVDTPEIYQHYLNSQYKTVKAFCDNYTARNLNEKTISKNFRSLTPVYGELKKFCSDLLLYLDRKLDATVSADLHIMFFQENLFLCVEPKKLEERFFKIAFAFTDFSFENNQLHYIASKHTEDGDDLHHLIYPSGWQYLDISSLEHEIRDFKIEFRKESKRQLNRDL
jgi:hypothetical protein